MRRVQFRGWMIAMFVLALIVAGTIMGCLTDQSADPSAPDKPDAVTAILSATTKAVNSPEAMVITKLVPVPWAEDARFLVSIAAGGLLTAWQTFEHRKDHKAVKKMKVAQLTAKLAPTG